MFFCAFFCAPKPKRVCMFLPFFVLFLCSKRSGYCAFLVLETIRLCFFLVLFWCSRIQTCLYVCVFFCAFLVLETIRLLCFSCARNDPIVFFSCAFLVLQKPNVFVCLCFFLCSMISKHLGSGFFWCWKRSDCVSFLALILLGLFEGRANPHLFAGKLLKATSLRWQRTHGSTPLRW